ncbi:hypothetical protein SeLEV6574_g05716 [Synchytrium endobioticum]|uniref:Uncharacterized protein n=1 Tax=Synchytrium endobioticum TaxID=286115 RepID=A0A507CSV5_9FUNG|nr:hypothetical protein SeLEV6574_g05716 [Synchytrium endobioticum]
MLLYAHLLSYLAYESPPARDFINSLNGGSGEIFISSVVLGGVVAVEADGAISFANSLISIASSDTHH